MRRWWAVLLVAATACGDILVAPPRNLFRPSALALVSPPSPDDSSPELVFLMDTENSQLVLVDAVAGLLRDLDPGTPGFNGVRLGGELAGLASRSDGTQVVATNFGLGLLQVVCTTLAATPPRADEECPAPRLLREVEVGAAPEGVVMVGSRAFVSRPRHGLVVEVDVDAGAVIGSFAVGGRPRGLAATADGGRLWVANSGGTSLFRIDLATREVRAVDVGAPTREVFISPSPQWIYALRDDRGTLRVVDPATETLVNTNPFGPVDAGPDITLPAAATGMTFQFYPAEESRPAGAGQFGFVTTTDGTVYAITTEGPPGEVHKLAHSGGGKPTPALVSAPTLFVGGAPKGVTDAEPRILGFLVSPTFGVTLSDLPRVVRSESWAATYEGTLPGASPSPASLRAGDVLVNPDVAFGRLVVPDSGEPVVQDGDLVVFLDDPVAEDRCARMKNDDTGRRRRWRLTLLPDRENELALSPERPDPLPGLTECYGAGPVRYEVRAAGAWTVVGSTSGYHGRAFECPNATPDADCGPFTYRSLFFSFVLKSGTAPSEPDMRWAFTVSDGVRAVVVSLTSGSAVTAPGLPRAAAASKRRDRTLYVLDEGDESLSFVDANLRVFRVIR